MSPPDPRLLELIGDTHGLLDLDEFRVGVFAALKRAIPCDWVSINEVPPASGGEHWELVEPEEGMDPIMVAIVGRPNVGKSSLINALVGEERSIVSDVPGTTRDVVDTRLVRDDSSYVLLDTAGLRRKSRVDTAVEHYSVVRAVRAIGAAMVLAWGGWAQALPAQGAGAQPLPPTPATQAVDWPAPGTGDRNKQQFIQAAAPAAQDSQHRLGIPASVIIANLTADQ